MIKAIAQRIGYALLSLLALLIMVFTLVRFTGDPVYFQLPPDASRAQIEHVRHELGLDQPVPVQFVVYVRDLLSGDLGISFKARTLGTHVTDLIAQRVPATLTMGAAALLLIILVGVPLGVYSAYWRGGWVDRIARFVAAIGQSVPSFWLGLLLILVLAIELRWLPSGGYGSLSNLVLPAITLALGPIAGLTRLLRSSMIESLGSDYIMFHRVKGMTERSVLWKHALRNAGLTTIGFLGIVTANLFTGSVLVETVFVWPGTGRLMIESIGVRDFPVIQGLILLYGSVYIGVNLFLDVLYAVLNPRLR
jgi:peptide/nickel transport system permease protein